MKPLNAGLVLSAAMLMGWLGVRTPVGATIGQQSNAEFQIVETTAPTPTPPPLPPEAGVVMPPPKPEVASRPRPPYPQTGEQANGWLRVIGVVIVVEGVILLVQQKRRERDG